jgi:hypothetical protein
VYTHELHTHTARCRAGIKRSRSAHPLVAGGQPRLLVVLRCCSRHKPPSLRASHLGTGSCCAEAEVKRAEVKRAPCPQAASGAEVLQCAKPPSPPLWLPRASAWAKASALPQAAGGAEVLQCAPHSSCCPTAHGLR